MKKRKQDGKFCLQCRNNKNQQEDKIK